MALSRFILFLLYNAGIRADARPAVRGARPHASTAHCGRHTRANLAYSNTFYATKSWLYEHKIHPFAKNLSHLSAIGMTKKEMPRTIKIRGGIVYLLLLAPTYFNIIAYLTF